MTISNKTLLIWAIWIMATLFFAWSVYWAPTPTGECCTAPELFLSLLGITHLVGGVVLTVVSLAEDNHWNN